ncbi:FAD-binding domain-containing protein [Agrocybe pediades]|nr:FAD-binding domain-containing protein [Agrocybe pediades]
MKSTSFFANLAGGLLSLNAVTASQADWTTLNATVGGRLQVGVPFSQPCFPHAAGGPKVQNEALCAEIQARNEDHIFRAQHFGAYELTQWEQCQTQKGDECMMDWTNPTNAAAFAPPRQCRQGSVPPVYLEVNDVDDVRAAYNFTKKTKVPLVVKNSGHDYIGRSAGPGSLALWMKNLQKIELETQFVPAGCPPATKPALALTIGAGQQFRTILDFAKENNITFAAGADPSVGASGGWVMGGGHSGLSPTFGLGVDRVLEFKIVTPDGVLRTANKCQNEDLFFALRGGGGGTFGVVLESTFVVEPTITVQVVLGMYNATRENSKKLIQELAKGAEGLAADGWGGYVTPALASGVWLHPSFSEEEAQKSSQSLLDAFASVGGSHMFFTMPTFTDFFDTFIAPNTDQVGRPQVLATRLFSGAALSDPVTVDAMIDGMLDSDFGQILAVTPYNVKDTGTSINPAWRKAVWHTLMSYNWNFGSTLDEIVAQYNKLTEKWAVVRERTADSGTYLNEADVFEPNYQTAFWGDNYDKLLAIKNKYDPDHLLDCWHCVGWKGPQDPLYKCYPDPSGTLKSSSSEEKRESDPIKDEL